MNGKQHAIRVRECLIVPEAQHAIAPFLEPFRARGIAIGSIMLPAIELNDERCFRAEEVDDVCADRLLPSKTKSAELLLAKPHPEMALGIGRVPTQFAGARRTHAPILNPSPLEGEGRVGGVAVTASA